MHPGSEREYQIQPNSRRCSRTGKELQAGEQFYSALVDVEGQLVRQDFGTEGWQGPPEGAFSFWMGRMPDWEDKRLPPIDDDMLLECFERLEGQTDSNKINFRYVLALLLLRRKRLRFEEPIMQAGQEIITVRSTRGRQKYQLVNPRLSEEEMTAVQEEVFRVLGWE